MDTVDPTSITRGDQALHPQTLATDDIWTQGVDYPGHGNLNRPLVIGSFFGLSTGIPEFSVGSRWRDNRYPQTWRMLSFSSVGTFRLLDTVYL